jgi:hypothetical protein
MRTPEPARAENNMKTRHNRVRPRVCICIALGAAAGVVQPHSAECQIAPEQAAQIQDVVGDRVEALTILGGDYGLAGGDFRSTGRFQFGGRTTAQLGVTKAGGSGTIGDPQPVGDLNIGWQPQLQGNMGYLVATNDLNDTLLQGDVNRYDSFAVEFGGGVALWLSSQFSVAPTLMVLYGRTSNTYTANSAFMKENLPLATQMGLVGWSAESWILRPALDFQYVINWDRTIITLTSSPTYFHTVSFSSSNPNVGLSGNSGFLGNTVDVDIPLGLELWGHELRTGGDFSRTDLFGGLKTGLNEEYLYEVHGRLVLDFLNQLWKVQWIGIGASYNWGSNIKGWSAGADVAFRF